MADQNPAQPDCEVTEETGSYEAPSLTTIGSIEEWTLVAGLSGDEPSKTA